MMHQKSSGFTIIEVVLFLAVGGLLGVGILAGASQSVNQQRYQDAVRSLASELQSQYSAVVNVENDRAGNSYRCNQGATVIDTSVSGGVAQSRGTSDCTIVGRVIDVTGGNKIMTSQPVYATADPMKDSILPTSDVDALRKSNLVVPSASTANALGRDSYELEWGTSSVSPTGAARQFRLLVVRSPFSNMVRTYAVSGGTVEPTSTTTVRSMIGTQAEVTICVNPDGLFTGQELGVRVLRGASTAAGVKQLEGGVC